MQVTMEQVWDRIYRTRTSSDDLHTDDGIDRQYDPDEFAPDDAEQIPPDEGDADVKSVEPPDEAVPE